ncbi:SPF45-like protein [Mya arenaria]|uniref:SPF45-like protein n=1 Tax=Mya arenaria TaxID=6604 RepID=A0ABY7E4V6_MYAAR|nr:SPF45-like protein [Mya arenaria]
MGRKKRKTNQENKKLDETQEKLGERDKEIEKLKEDHEKEIEKLKEDHEKRENQLKEELEKLKNDNKRLLDQGFKFSTTIIPVGPTGFDIPDMSQGPKNVETCKQVGANNGSEVPRHPISLKTGEGRNYVASKIMPRYGYKEGQGLGKSEQGMSKIIHERDLPKDTPREVQTNANVLRNPTKVVLLRMPDTTEDESVRVFVEFDRIDSAIKAIIDLNGRYFGRRVVRACFYNFDKFRQLDLGADVENPP